MLARTAAFLCGLCALQHASLAQAQAPASPDVPDAHDASGAPDVPDVPDVPGAHDAPGSPDVPDVPGAHDAPGSPDIPDVPDVPGAHDAPGSPDAPDVLDLSPEELTEIADALGHDQLALQAAGSGAGASGPGPVRSALQSMNPDISLVLDMAVAYFSDEDHLQSGAHDPGKTGFNLQQLEMSFASAVDPYFRFDAHLVFSEFGVEIEEAYATTLALPYSLQARIGQFLTRIGRINPTHPHGWDFVDQPLALGRIFGAEGNRGLGLELSYLTPLPWYVEIIGSVTDAAGAASARSFFGPQPMPVVSPLDAQSSLMVKQFFALGPNWSVLWGLSAATGPNATGHDNRSDIYATDLYIQYRPITRASATVVALQTEWFHRRRQISRDLLTDVSGYAQLVWRFAQRWGTAARYDYGSPARNRAGAAEGDYLDPEWIASRHRASANLTFWPTEFSRIRLQGSVDAPGWRDAPIHALFLAFEFTVGAHGAHKF